MKLSSTEHADAFLPRLRRGKMIEDSVQVCSWLEDAAPTQSTSRPEAPSPIR